MKLILIAGTTILALATTPASAQLLGGSGLGQTIGGLSGGLSGGLGSTIGGTLGRSGETRLDRSVDRRSGRVSTRASTRQSADGGANGSTDVIGRTIGGSASGSGSGSADAGITAQAIGTDAVRGAVQPTAGLVRGTAGSARDAAFATVTSAGSSANTVGGSANAAGSLAGSAQGSLGQLTATGSGAASGAGNFAVQPGMMVEDAKGRAIGTVQSLRTSADGTVTALLMTVGDRSVALPAGNFTASGDALVSAMSKGEVKSEAKRQEDAAPNAEGGEQSSE
ncbi:hypothetical protein [Sphingomonas colocasiae]|uniref:PRC-barrel domain-containing protein n=1 Tax=Sphingomonas colocasiae TaxID=1848973 RepID=A0ABS7PHZ4_9SPHN|nr:hypothetical protein [Sphingomonas colocasiae]MBY8820911.1 hypothetical protein [Sphingomonas colocasiae]